MAKLKEVSFSYSMSAQVAKDSWRKVELGMVIEVEDGDDRNTVINNVQKVVKDRVHSEFNRLIEEANTQY